MRQTRRWQDDLERWLQPFLIQFQNRKQAHWAPFYLRGLLGPGRRKSVEPIAERVAPGQTQQLHHFISTSNWALEPLEAVLVKQVDMLAGGPEALLIVDDTALVKKGRHSPGVAHQYCGELGKKANCQSLVSLTLASREVPVPIALRLFLPESWAEDRERRAAAKVPESLAHRPKWKIALAEIDRVRRQGAHWGVVVADAEYGKVGEFRQALSRDKLPWAVGVMPNTQVYPADVVVSRPAAKPMGRPPKHPVVSVEAAGAQVMIASLPRRAWRTISWRRGTRGRLKARFAMVRVRVAEGREIAQGRRLPGAEELWLVCEERAGGERKYYLSNLAPRSKPVALARAIKGRWACEQAHQQMKREVGLDHFECRGWLGLHHHALLVMMAYAFLQWLRLREKKGGRGRVRRPNRACRMC